MIPSQNQQAHLADFAPKQSLDKYAKGADPRVINGIVALSEMQQQAAMRQQANLASGAAQGQMPTVRDKIMQMFQQANQPRQQPQQQPNPMQQGIMAQAHPQMQTAPMPQGEAPEEAQMYHGGVAHLPVNDRMFGYANGGIIAFAKGDEVPKAEVPIENPEFDSEGNPRSRSEREAIQEQNARLRAEVSNAQELADLRERRMAGLGAVNPDMAERMDQYYKPRRPDVTDLSQVQSSGGVRPSPVVGVSEDEAARARAQAAAVDPRRVGIAAGTNQAPARPAPPTANAAPPNAAPPAGNVTPPTKPPATAGTGIDALIAQQATRLQAQANAPKMPEPDVVEGGLKYLKAQDDYVRKTGDSDAAKKLYNLYDKMAQRALADDNAQAAQKAEDARNNLWSFLSNTRGSSLAVAAGKADAALQPLLAEQKAANAAYRKYSYERDMNREKAHAEAMAAEEARKRGDFAKAIEHEQKERTYRLEAKKAEDTVQHYRNTEMNQVLSTAATRESAREGHLTQVQVANIHAAAQRAGFNKPSEAERVREEYNRIRTEKGQKAADEFLSDETKIRAAVGGAKYEGPDKSVQNRAKVYEILNKNESYTTAQETIRRLEAKTKRTPQEEQRLAQARKYTQDTFNNTYKGIYGTGPDADTGSSGGFPVTAPDGKTYNFKTQAEADAFRAKIGG